MTETSQRALFLGLTVALAAALRFYALGEQPLWLDEATTADYAASSLVGAIFAEGAHPPLFYVIEHLVVRWLGSSDALLRLPSAVFGILAVPAAWVAARQLFPKSPATAPAAAALVATSPFLIYLSQEARNYSLLILLALVATVYFLRFCGDGEARRGGRPADLLIYTLLSVLLLYTHYYGVWVLAAHEAVYWLHARVERKAWLLARVNVALAFFLWAQWAIYQAKLHTLAWTGNALWRVPYALLRDLVGYGIAPHAAPGSDPIGVILREEGLVVALTAGPLLWLLLRGARRLASEARARTLLIALLVAPLLLMVAVSPWVKLLHERAVSFQAPFVLLLIAYGWTTLARRKRLLAAALCGGAIAFALAAYYGAPGELFGYRLRYGKEDWRRAAAYVEQSKPDAVILTPAYIHLAFHRYWSVPPGAVPVVRMLPGSELSLPWRVSSARRIALVLSHAGPAEERLRQHLDDTRRRVAEMNFTAQNGIRVYLYEPVPDSTATPPP